MQKTKERLHSNKNADFVSFVQFRRGNCDDWGNHIGKRSFKDWPDFRKTEKDCNDWIDDTCREAVSRVQEFNKLVQKWKEDTMFMSSVTQMAIHPCYQRIIGMGQPALPLILKELQQSPPYWFWALEAITGGNPAEKAVTFDEGVANWLNWGRVRGYLK